MRFLPILPAGFLLIVFAPVAGAQYVRSVPYDAQLKTDPAVGNVQGIQRYGRALKTDPDQGVGFSYHVYPVSDATNVAVNQGANMGGSAGGGSGLGIRSAGDGALGIRSAPARSMSTVLRSELVGSDEREGLLSRGARVQALERQIKDLQDRINEGDLRGDDVPAAQAQIAELDAQSETLQQELIAEKARSFDTLERTFRESGVAGGGAAGGVVQSTFLPGNRAVGGPFSPGMTPGSPYPAPFDWTQGIRNFGAATVPTTPYADSPDDAPFSTRSMSVSRAGLTFTTPQIYHQPLVQIKMRIVEVVRTDGLQVASALEYVSRNDTDNSLTSGRTTNNRKQNFRGVTTFDLPGLITGPGMGTGALINLTSEHVNWLLQALAVEMNADVVTAPEVVTLNGQNVEFVSGDKLPFQLGQNVVQGTNNNIQQVFYKHVGTMVSVTPRIVNWGLHGEGQGEAAIVAHDILDWRALLEEMHKAVLSSELTFQVKRLKPDVSGGARLAYENLADTINTYRTHEAIPYSVQSDILKALNDYSRCEMLSFLGSLAELQIITHDACDRCRRWKPENCTIDLSVVVRLSEGAGVQSNPDDTDLTNVTTNEKNVRAVANVIQVKSGHGVVMAGLIGEREDDEVRKTPVLGDLPFVGFAFRSKVVNRVKTEVLVFVEASVLDPNPCVARAESSHDFLLSQPYVDGEFLDNPLEFGMYRVGFGSYLPPHTHGETIFWERFGRKVRKIHTHIDDTFLQ